MREHNKRSQVRNIEKILPLLLVLLLLLPLCLTLYSWQFVKSSTYQNKKLNFNSLVIESESALEKRLASYENAVLGGAGLFQSSYFISHAEWRSYVETLNINENFPGMNGLGWIKDVVTSDLPDHLGKVRQGAKETGRIQPKTKGKPHYIISYIEPEKPNLDAIGLNIAFEHNRAEGADLARDTGKATITKPITLVQDNEKTPGFLILQPVLKEKIPDVNAPNKVSQSNGWVYAPLIAKKILAGLTKSQGKSFALRIYDGEAANADSFIYSSDSAKTSSGTALFSHAKTIDVMQQRWHVVWESTLSFEQQESNVDSVFVLAGGLLFTGLLGVFLIAFGIRRIEARNDFLKIEGIVFPLAVFVVFASGSIWLCHTQKQADLRQVRALVKEETDNIKLSIEGQIKEKFNALNRMASRWGFANGTPYDVWRQDAENYITAFPGIQTIEWADDSYHVRWVEPVKGNEEAVGHNIILDSNRRTMLENAATRNNPTATAPFKLIQGYDAFVVYMPVQSRGEFDGFMMGVISISDFFEHIFSNKIAADYIVSAYYDGVEYFNNNPHNYSENTNFQVDADIHIYAEIWSVHISPTNQLIDNRMTFMPLILLISGLVISALSALAVRFIIIAKVRTQHLLESEKFSNTVIENIPDFLFVKDKDFRIVKANSKFLSLYPESVRHSVIGSVAIAGYVQSEVDTFSEKDREAFSKGCVDYEEEVSFPNGETYPLHSIKIRFKNTKNEQYILCISRDVSERKQHDKDRESLTQKLFESNTELERFAYVASHDMQEPLRMITSFSEIVTADYSSYLDETAREYLELIRSAGERMSSMVNDLLEYSLLDQSKVSVSNVNAKEELKHVLDNLTQLIKETSAQVTSDKLPTFQGSSLQFMRLLQNLVANGIKYQSIGSVPRIHISVKEEGTQWHFTVSDNGVGIGEEFTAQVFLPFRRLQSWDKVKGSGIGLAVCKKIVESHGGEIWVVPSEEEGSVFHFTISKNHTDMNNNPNF